MRATKAYSVYLNILHLTTLRIPTCLLKAGTTEPIDVTATTATHTREDLLKAVFPVGSVQRLRKENQLGLRDR
jgi:hypothetical protein